MPPRRDVLRTGAWAAAGAATGHLRAATAQSQTLLILGGTGFLGPPLTEEALRRGWKVTHFNRGKHAAGGVAGVETLIGDRRGELDSLRGRKWDAMVDDTGFVPKFVEMSAELLAPNVGYCLFVSSTSVYATYGPMKALCEQYSATAFKGRASIVRSGYMVGPLDPSDRFTYWPVRASRGGEMLAPGTPRDPIQFNVGT